MGAPANATAEAGEEEASSSPRCIRVLLALFNTRLGIVLLFLLLVLDVATVVASGFLDAHFLLSQVDDCKAHYEACRVAPQRRQLQGGAGGDGWPPPGASRGLAAPVTCGPEPDFGDHGLHDAELVMAYISTAILAIFFLEQLLRMAAEGCRRYFSQPLCVLDLFVITLSLVLELLVTHLPMGGLLVLARIWRFARTGYTTYEGLHDVVRVRPALDSLGAAAMESVWGKLPERRWEALASGEASSGRLQLDEEQLALEVAKASPAFVLQALALENERLREAGKSLRDLARSEDNSSP